MKRLFDVAVSIALSRLCVLAALAVKFTSQGSILCGVRRAGNDGTPIRVWKFGTMVPNADKTSTVPIGFKSPLESANFCARRSSMRCRIIADTGRIMIAKWLGSDPKWMAQFAEDPLEAWQGDAFR